MWISCVFLMVLTVEETDLYGVFCLAKYKLRGSSFHSEGEGLGDLVFIPLVADAWKGMGTRCFSYPPMPPISALVILFLLGICINSAVGCDGPLTDCWDLMRKARYAEKSGDSKIDLLGEAPKCIVYRTYVNCLVKNATPNCIHNIRFQGAKRGYEKKMKNNNCSPTGRVYEPIDPVDTIDPGPYPDPERLCNYLGERNYRHCGLFGDPHLRTFNDEFQTCKVEGAWSLLNNKYLTVQVTNDPVVATGAATATSKLTVVIKKNEDCGARRFITYAAQTDSLPGTFDNGQTKFGTDDSVTLYEIDPGKHIKIHLRYIATWVVVRQIGRYFTFSIKMPEDVIGSGTLDDDLELCVQGCPKQERINYQKYLAGKRSQQGMARSDAVEMCRGSQVVDFYFDSCVFDLMTTGDPEFTVSAYRAWQDLINLTPEIRKTQTNRTDLSRYDKAHSGVASLYRTTYILLLTILVCVWQPV